MSRAMDAPSRMAFVVAALVAMVLRAPRLVLALGAAAIAGSIWLSYAKLEYHTQRNDLLSAEKECQKRWQKYLDAFGDDDDMIVVVKGTDRKRMQAAAALGYRAFEFWDWRDKELNAITRTGQEVKSYDRAVELETAGSAVLKGCSGAVHH